MKLLVLLIVILCGIILCKAISVGIILLFMYVKGKSFNFDTKKWDEWFSKINDKKLFWMFAGVYIISSIISSLVAYALLNHFEFKYALWIALIFFAVRMAITWLRYHKSGKEYITSQVAKIRKTVLKDK